MREEYHSPFGRTAKNACIEPCSLCLPSSALLFMPSLTTRPEQVGKKEKDHLEVAMTFDARQGSFHITH